ncbi:MAG: MarC family protein [Lentisphaeria bacterium]
MFIQRFLFCLVPLFVAVDALGVLPLFVGMTAEAAPERRRQVIWQSVATAAAVSLAFLLLGKGVLKLLGITVADFMVAGGVLLFALALNDLLSVQGHRRRQPDPEGLGVVPLGVPLISGPAVLTTSLLLVDLHGFAPTALALVANIAAAGVVFAAAPWIYRWLGKAGTRALSKLASLLLAAIAVMMVRKGLVAFGALLPRGG